MDGTPHRRRRRGSPPPRNRTPVALLFVAVICLTLLLREQQSDPLARPTATAATMAPQLEAHLRTLLPAGATLLQSLPLRDGSTALAWQMGQAAHTGVAFLQPGGGYRLWTASTPGRADSAAQAEVALITLPGIAEEVLVSTYRTEGCCAWVNLFQLTGEPRVLFASPTSTARLLGTHIIVQRRLPGLYPEGTAGGTEVYAWNGSAFALSGETLAPSHYFPLASRMRWRYRSDGQMVERWVQEGQREGETVRFLVRSLTRQGSDVSALQDTIYIYGSEGQVEERSPEIRQVLPPSPAEGSAWEAFPGQVATVVGVKPWITVPAGTFQDVLVVAIGEVRQYYAPHVGLIREDRQGKPHLELLSYVNE